VVAKSHSAGRDCQLARNRDYTHNGLPLSRSPPNRTNNVRFPAPRQRYNPTMLGRSARKQLTQRQELIARQHFARLLNRWAGNLNQSRCARLWANARCLALHPERLTSEHGWRLRRQRGARAAHQAMRAQGRTPGDEGRTIIAWNREARKRDREQGKGWRVSQTYMNNI
jgi:hypothetical protein